MTLRNARVDEQDESDPYAYECLPYMPYDPPPPRGGVVRAEFDPGSENAIPAALRRQMTTKGGGSRKIRPPL